MPTDRISNGAAERKGPYARAAIGYFRAGYFPIPVNGKVPRVKGYHGREGDWPDLATVKGWVKQFPTANVALRLAPGQIGLDVDCYDGRPGAESLVKFREEFGLPLTVMSTSRDDGSGIRLYNLPPGYEEADFSSPGPGIDIITWCIRYAVVPPSVHESGRVYRWIKES